MNAVVAPATLRAWPSRDAAGRTHQNVHSPSREAYRNEKPEYLSARQRRERLAAFQKHATGRRLPGRRRGAGWDEGRHREAQPEAYSTIAGEVLNYLMFFAVETGLVFPSYEQIAKDVGCAYRTAVRAVHQLKNGGWLSWERRFIRTGKDGDPEPQVEQTSNLYRLHVPNIATRMMEAWRAARRPRPADVPDRPDPDAEARQDLEKRREAAQAFTRAARTPAELEVAERREAAIHAALAKLERGVTRRSEAAADPGGGLERGFPEGGEAPFEESI